MRGRAACTDLPQLCEVGCASAAQLLLRAGPCSTSRHLSPRAPDARLSPDGGWDGDTLPSAGLGTEAAAA